MCHLKAFARTYSCGKVYLCRQTEFSFLVTSQLSSDFRVIYAVETERSHLALLLPLKTALSESHQRESTTCKFLAWKINFGHIKSMDFILIHEEL